MSWIPEKWQHFWVGVFLGGICIALIATASDFFEQFKPQKPIDAPTEFEYDTCIKGATDWVLSLDNVLDGYHLSGAELTKLIQRQHRTLAHKPLRILDGFLLVRSYSDKHLKIPYFCLPFEDGSAYVDVPSYSDIEIFDDEKLEEFAKKNIDDIEEWRIVMGRDPEKI